MRTLLSIGVMTLVAAATPQQAGAGVNCSFGFGIDWHFTFQHKCHRHCGHGYIPQYIAVFPSFEHCAVSAPQEFPPQPGAEQPRPQSFDETVRWGYPNLNYAYHHPVSYYRAQPQPEYIPAQQYYPAQNYYPPSYNTPHYYPSHGVTFDR